ncbi:MAG: hypothetical protein IJU72_10945 [Bacteroidales bacterium]|nr:hypothetical protein [Bacteroidales bacterium]
MTELEQEQEQQPQQAQNELVEFVEEEPVAPKRTDGLRVSDFLTGNILTRESIARQFPFMMFLVLLAVMYIGNHYRYDRLMRREQTLRQEVKNLRAESVTTAATLMQISRQSEVVKLVNQKNLGLEESTTPPKVIK